MFEAFSAAGFFVHNPFGPRKSGIPESVEIPAPVSTTIRSAPASGHERPRCRPASRPAVVRIGTRRAESGAGPHRHRPIMHHRVESSSPNSRARLRRCAGSSGRAIAARASCSARARPSIAARIAAGRSTRAPTASQGAVRGVPWRPGATLRSHDGRGAGGTSSRAFASSSCWPRPTSPPRRARPSPPFADGRDLGVPDRFAHRPLRSHGNAGARRSPLRRRHHAGRRVPAGHGRRHGTVRSSTCSGTPRIPACAAASPTARFGRRTAGGRRRTHRRTTTWSTGRTAPGPDDEWLAGFGDVYSHAAVIGANLDPISGDAPGEIPYAAAIFLHRHSYNDDRTVQADERMRVARVRATSSTSSACSTRPSGRTSPSAPPPGCDRPPDRQPRQRGERRRAAASNTSVWRSTSASTWAGDISAMLWNGVISTPRLSAHRCMNVSSSSSTAAAAAAPSRGGGQNQYSARQPSCCTVQSKPAPFDRRRDARRSIGSPAGSSGRSRRRAASSPASPAPRRGPAHCPVSVPPTPATSESCPVIGPTSRLGDRVGHAVGGDRAHHRRSACRSRRSPDRASHAAVQPPGPAQIVCVSSMISSVPARRVSSPHAVEVAGAPAARCRCWSAPAPSAARPRRRGRAPVRAPRDR